YFSFITRGRPLSIPFPYTTLFRSSVEGDQVMRADVTQSMDANGDPWGLDRIDQGALPLSRTYTYTGTGAGVHAYIIDTGIWTLRSEEHTSELQSRFDLVCRLLLEK